MARDRGESLSSALKRAGVSRTAYYSLLRRPSILPKTVVSLSATLGVAFRDLLEDDEPDHGSRLREAQRVLKMTPGAWFENVWHTLCLLDLDPVERLNRSLIRGRATAIHG